MTIESRLYISERESTKQRLAGIFEKNLGLEAPPVDADLFESGTLSSLTFVEMLFEIEEEFDIALSLDMIDLERFQTVASIAGFIEDQTPESASRPTALADGA